MTDISTIDETLLYDHTLWAHHLAVGPRAANGYYVVTGSGGVVSQKSEGANMSVDVAAFQYALAGVFGSKESKTNVVVTAAHATLHRIDILYLAAGGTLTIEAGTAAAITPSGATDFRKMVTPAPPDMKAIPGIILAEIYVAAAATTIVDANIRMIAVKNI